MITPLTRSGPRPGAVAIELRDLSKRYGPVTAVDGLTVDVRPGRVTGFLGPNGAGKSTTLRMILGLDAPTTGTAHVGGLPYRRLPHPLRTVGALLDAHAVHPARTAAAHLLALARSNGVAPGRVDDVLGEVGLADVAGRRTSTYSLGMLQRLGIAAALLGDPPVLLFDEPMNGLDPEGIRWIRGFMREKAAEGRTVFVSSHLMAEMALATDHVVVLGQGRLVADVGTRELLNSGSRQVLVRLAPPDTPAAGTDTERFARRLQAAGARVTPAPDDALLVTGLPAADVGRLAAAAQLPLAELTPQQASLEDVFMDLTGDSLSYVTGARPAGADLRVTA